MLLAIDVGNTHSVFGLWDGNRWHGPYRRATSYEETEDELAVWLRGIFDLVELPFHVDGVICGSVAPGADTAIRLAAERWLGVSPKFLTSGQSVGLEVLYDPPHAVGADRIANALAALQLGPPPWIIVDFGTATTFDAIDRGGRYLGGAILPGLALQNQALSGRTAKLPSIALKAPGAAIGKTTVASLQSGILLGHAGAIDRLAREIDQELGGGSRVIATGGLGEAFVGLCPAIEAYHPSLTLDGLRIAYERLGSKDAR